MNNIGDRILEIRKSKKLSQEEFGQAIGLSRSQIGCYETNLKNVSNRSIRDICLNFNINENWLRTGAGEMYNATDSLDINVSDDIKDMIRKFMALNEKDQEKLNKILDVFISESEN